MSARIDGAADSRLDVTWRFDLNYVTLARHAREIVEREFEHVACTNWATERQTLEGIFEHTIATLRGRSERAAVLDLSKVVGEECLAHLSLQHGHAELRVAARTVDALAAAKAWIRERYRVTVPLENRDVAVTFWSLSERGPRCRTRRIAVPSWPGIAVNYPCAVRRTARAVDGRELPSGTGRAAPALARRAEVDGLIGQGLRATVLITTNEPLGSLHLAVARPGRCAAQIEFVPFSADEAGEWVERHGEAGGDRAATLATLFARSAGVDVRERKNPLGFA